MRILLFFVGLVFFLNGAFMFLVSNLNLGVILTICVGVFFLLWSIFYKAVKKHTQEGIFKWVKRAVTGILCVEICLTGFIAFYGQTENVNYNEDAVIVLGAGIHGDRVSMPLAYRLNTAVEYHRKNPDAVIVVTGGQGLQETVTEAYAMEKYLLRKGIAPEKIIKEERATSTNENMRFSKEILDKHFEGEYSVVVITNNFHTYRGVKIAKMEGFEKVYRKPAGLKWYNVLPCYLRESLAVLKMWVFD